MGARGPFRFWGCSEIRESLGIRADSERELLERLETAPGESIYYHTVRCLLRRRVVNTPFPDDFSTWVAVQVRDQALAEQLALDSPFEFPDLEAFRERLLEILDDHLSRLGASPRVLQGEPFYFLRGHLTAVPLELEAVDLPGFRAALARVDDSSVYYHAIEAIGRLDRPSGDFAAWVEDVLGLPRLAAHMAAIDPFVASLAGVRQRLLDLLDSELAAPEAR
jgi:hypothetical protein